MTPQWLVCYSKDEKMSVFGEVGRIGQKSATPNQNIILLFALKDQI